MTEAVRRRPYSVILFDEIEKAHHDVFNVLLQLLDDGRLTDGQGRTVDFKNTVVIMTSNIASQLILSFKGREYEKMKEECLEVLRQSFRPEFLNRVDEIVVFHPLSKAQLRQIVDIQIARLRKRLAERKIELELDRQGARLLSPSVATIPVYGARPLRRMIQRELETALGRKHPSGEVRDGSKVVVDAGPRGLSFEVKAPPPRPRPHNRARFGAQSSLAEGMRSLASPFSFPQAPSSKLYGARPMRNNPRAISTAESRIPAPQAEEGSP